MAVTIQSVAEEAGVSPATVSRVFNETAPVEESTRDRVLEAADELGYVPNATARNLSIKQTDTFGVLLPFLTGEYYPEVIRGLDQTAQQQERFLLLSSSHHTTDNLKRALGSMHGRVDGLILMMPRLAATDFQTYLPSDMPVVLLNCAPGGHEFSVLSVDNHEGGRMATEHLVEEGHERIGIITGELTNYDARERLGGYHTAMNAADLSGRDEWIVSGNFSRKSGKEAARRLMEIDPRPTAIFVSNDYMAMGAIQTLRQMGIEVPRDVAIVGFDNIPSAKHFTPSLTTIDAQMVDLGTEAIAMMMEIIDESETQRVKHLSPNLHVRASSRKPTETSTS